MGVAKSLVWLGVLAVSGIAQAGEGAHHTVRFLNRHRLSRSIRMMEFSPDSSILAVGVAWGSVHVIRTRDGETVRKVAVNPQSLRFCRNGALLLEMNNKKGILWDVARNRAVNLALQQAPGFLGISYQPRNGKWLMSDLAPGGPGKKSGKIQVGDELIGLGQGRAGRIEDVRGLSGQRLGKTLEGPAGTYCRLQVIHQGKLTPETYVLRRYAKRRVRGVDIYVPPQHVQATGNLIYRQVDGWHQFRQASNGRLISQFRTQDVPIPSLTAISPDEKHFAVLGRSDDGLAIEVFEITTADRLLFAKLPSIPIPNTLNAKVCFDMVFSPDGSRLLVGTWDTLQRFHLKTKTWEKAFRLDEGARRPVKKRRRSGITFGPVFSTADSLGIEYDTHKWGLQVVNTLAVSPQGIFATGSREGKVKLWDLQTGRLLKNLPVLKDERENVEWLMFSPDGRWLAYFIEGVVHLVDVDDVKPAEKSTKENDSEK